MDPNTQIMLISKRMTRKLQAFIRSRLSSASKELLDVTEEAIESLEKRTDAKIISSTECFLDRVEDLEEQMYGVVQVMEKEGVKQGLYMKQILKELQEIHHCMSSIVKNEQDINLNDLGMDHVAYPSAIFCPSPQKKGHHSNQSTNPAVVEHGYDDILKSPEKSVSCKQVLQAEAMDTKKLTFKDELNYWENEGHENKRSRIKAKHFREIKISGMSDVNQEADVSTDEISKLREVGINKLTGFASSKKGIVRDNQVTNASQLHSIQGHAKCFYNSKGTPSGRTEESCNPLGADKSVDAQVTVDGISLRVVEDCPEGIELPPKKKHCISQPLGPLKSMIGCTREFTIAVKNQDASSEPLSPPKSRIGCRREFTPVVKKQDASSDKQFHCLRKFTGSDVELLIRGIEKFGVGRWVDIKWNYFSSKKHWSTRVLKDKWRSLVHSALLPHRCRRSIDLTDSQVKRILHISGEAKMEYGVSRRSTAHVSRTRTHGQFH